MQPLIALLTDFGTRDHYVGVMKGVMKTLCPNADFIDITHDIPPQDVQAAAFVLLNNYFFFPPGTVFLVVVDPGVGTARRPIAVRTSEYAFIAPDNGVLSWCLQEQNVQEAVEVKPSREITELAGQLSTTFHGRDVFAPAAANLAAATPIEDLGASINDDWAELAMPAVRVDGQRIHGEVLYIDHFGNIVTNIGQLLWHASNMLLLRPRFNIDVPNLLIPAKSEVHIAGKTIHPLSKTYGTSAPGDWVALVGSSNFLEVAVNQGSAAQQLGVRAGDEVVLEGVLKENI